MCEGYELVFFGLASGQIADHLECETNKRQTDTGSACYMRLAAHSALAGSTFTVGLDMVGERDRVAGSCICVAKTKRENVACLFVLDNTQHINKRGPFFDIRFF